MNFNQTKLSKSEWTNAEIPVSEEEMNVLKIIKNGFHDVNTTDNMNCSLFQLLKLEYSIDNEYYLYKQYFENEIQKIIQVYCENKIHFSIDIKNIKSPKKCDMIRIKQLDKNIDMKKNVIFEYLLIDLCKKIMKSFYEKTSEYAFHLYTLIHIKKNKITNVNIYCIQFAEKIIEYGNNHLTITEVVKKSYEFIEKNPHLLKYADLKLYNHQKELFTVCKQDKEIPKLILYITPTGTGKTLSPVGLTERYRVIFLCASRHIGLGLAKSAISMGKKIAFAFGCETASDIRLHYFAASNYEKNKKSGGIGKVDNSDGTKVELIICDAQSYITAMHYMLAFNMEKDIITFWDEPTITMDYETHDLHEIIKKNWKNNMISKLILSCATLPKENEIQDVLTEFRLKFNNAEIHTITSFDFKKSISILNKDGKSVLPHLLFEDYDNLISCVNHCEENKSLLRYFDLVEVIKFITYINENKLISSDYSIENYFTKIADITMESLKLYYLFSLKKMDDTKWFSIYKHFLLLQEPKFITENHKNEFKRTTSDFIINSQSNGDKPLVKINSVNSFVENEKNAHLKGVLLTTKDAHTLTDGPTVFLTDDVHKIGKFYIHHSNIPETILNQLFEKIKNNDELSVKINKLQQLIEDKKGKKEAGDTLKRKDSRTEQMNPEIRKYLEQMDVFKQHIEMVHLNPVYVPNTTQHQNYWINDYVKNAFQPNIDSETVKQIMELEVENSMKILLLLGIGVFSTSSQIDVKYAEIMKRLAYEQKLYIIIASSDYIYGTNYSFCHGFIAKDLSNMTQQKIIQSLGRIGRNNYQQEYTVRFRDDELIKKLFTPLTTNIEAINMCKLFCYDE